MLNPREEIDKVLAIVKEKTGVVIPSDMIFVEETDRMRTKNRNGMTTDGVYYYDEEKIYLNPSIFSSVHTDREYWKERAENDTVRLNGKFTVIDTEEKFEAYMKESIHNKILWNIQFVIAHECGHYVHSKYFGCWGLRIPIKHGFGSNGRNSRKNATENFADGFAEYVLDLFLKKDGPRAKKMESIVERIRQIDAMDAEDDE